MPRIPTIEKQIIQNNRSDKGGNLWITKGVDLNEFGYIKGGSRLRTFDDSNTMTDFDGPLGPLGVTSFGITSSGVVALGTKDVYINDTQGGSIPTDYIKFIKDTRADVPTLNNQNNDSVTFDARLYVAKRNRLHKLTGNTWSEVSATGAGRLCVFENLNQLAVSVGSVVHLLSRSQGFTPEAIVTTLNLNLDYEVTCMTWNNNRLYIATKHLYNGDALLFEWDGLTAEANNAYPISGHTIFSVKRYKDGVVCVTSNGELLYNRGGFKKLAEFPIKKDRERNWAKRTNSLQFQKVPPNALLVDDDLIYIGIAGINDFGPDRNGPRIVNDFPSGVWCYDPTVGLYHKWAPDSSILLRTNNIATSSVNTTTNVITVAGTTIPETGTEMFYYTSTTGLLATITPLLDGGKYYVIKLTSTTLKVAQTKEDALAGTEINLTGTGNAAQYITFAGSDSVGSVDNLITAMTLLPINEFPNRINYILIGGSLRYPDGNYKSFIATTVADQTNHTYLITPKIDSMDTEDITNTILVKHKPLLDRESIIVKFRNDEDIYPNFISTLQNSSAGRATWTANDTFTTTRDLAKFKERFDEGFADEIEIVSGAGSGWLVHPKSVSESSGTYTVEIDEEIPNISTSDTFNFILSNWTRVGVITNEISKDNKEFRPAKKGTFIQVKIEMRGVEPVIEELVINNKTHKPVI